MPVTVVWKTLIPILEYRNVGESKWPCSGMGLCSNSRSRRKNGLVPSDPEGQSDSEVTSIHGILSSLHLCVYERIDIEQGEWLPK